MTQSKKDRMAEKTRIMTLPTNTNFNPDRRPRSRSVVKLTAEELAAIEAANKRVKVTHCPGFERFGDPLRARWAKMP